MTLAPPSSLNSSLAQRPPNTHTHTHARTYSLMVGEARHPDPHQHSSHQVA